MTGYVSQDDAVRLPHGMIRLLSLTEQSEPQPFDVWSHDAPTFHLVVFSAAEGSRLPQKLLQLLHEMGRSTGIRYFLLRSPQAVNENEPDQTVLSIRQKVRRMYWHSDTCG
jgi:hypothetical protein